MTNKASTPSSDSQGTKEINDFLYQDAARIGSFLAQFSGSGHLQAVTQIDRPSDNSSPGWGIKIGGGIASIANAEFGFERSNNESKGQSFEKTYDPLWINALSLLNYLKSKRLINESIASAKLGTFILCSGELAVSDTSLLQHLYKRPVMQKMARQKRGIDPETGKPFSDEELEIRWAALAETAPQIQTYIKTTEGTLWCTLKPNGMTIPSAEVILKHGVVIDGTWHVLGIKDADPTTNLEAHQQQVKNLQSRYPLHPFHGEAFFLNSFMKGWLGRPFECFGITPLAIFRTIGA